MSFKIPVLTYSQAQAFLLKAWEVRRIPVLIVGRYGVGKSSLAYWLSKVKKVPICDIKLSQFDSVSFRGIPDYSQEHGVKTTVWHPPSMLEKLNAEARSRGGGILFLDELDKAQRDVAAATYELLLQKRYGEFKLDESILIVSAVNLEADDWRGEGLSIPQLDRVCRFFLEPTVEEWLNWAREHGIDSRIISFIDRHPDMLWRPGDLEKMCTTSGRSWESASFLIAGETDFKLIENLVASAVGSDIAEVFTSFIKSGTLEVGRMIESRDFKGIAKLDGGEFQIVGDRLSLQMPSEALGFIGSFYLATKEFEKTIILLKILEKKLGRDKFATLLHDVDFPGKKEIITRLRALKTRDTS